MLKLDRSFFLSSTISRPIFLSLQRRTGRSSLSLGRTRSTFRRSQGLRPSHRLWIQRSVASVVDAEKATGSKVVRFYRLMTPSEGDILTLNGKLQRSSFDNTVLNSIQREMVFNIEAEGFVDKNDLAILTWLLEETFEPGSLKSESAFSQSSISNESEQNFTLLEVGPRLNFSTAWSTNAVSICHACGILNIKRIEKSSRFFLNTKHPLSTLEIQSFADAVHDRMTEQIYDKPLVSMVTDKNPDPVKLVPLIAQGRSALEQINEKMGLAFDEWDLNYYSQLFIEDLKRDPTNVELFDIAQSNSEHSRHWYFKGRIIIDGQPMPRTLMDIVQAPLLANPTNNSVIAFKDNSSAIRGGISHPLLPNKAGECSPLCVQEKDYDLLLTAETHNFPCAVAPLPGAETGTGGRIRDTHATGRGSIMGIATAGYCVGNLQFLHEDSLYSTLHQWRNSKDHYPVNLASPNQILIEASNGASDYGNKFGEPLIAGYTRTYGERLADGSRREWIKPIMFSGGVGQIDHDHLNKGDGKVSMLVVKIGGPAYPIGMGGGAASSLPGGSNKMELDFNAVQRGDAEMSQKLWRVVRSCVELGSLNPIVQIHDQGAGGNCNVVKEIVYPKGAEIDIKKVTLGDQTMSILEIWGAEYQENDCLLIKPENEQVLKAICERENCDMQVLGEISGTGRIVLKAEAQSSNEEPITAVDLDLEKVLGSMPQKTFTSHAYKPVTTMLDFSRMDIMDALEKILSLPSVCSKRFLTTKVDRSVTGLVAQQQCVGPLQLPLSNVAVMARSHHDFEGVATSIGEQPIKGLLNPSAMARLALGEALTNLVWAPVTSLQDIKASVNWMYAAKMQGEGAAMYEAAVAVSEMMIQLGLACDGGKDSLSMSAKSGKETVLAPGNLVVSTYVMCTDITQTITPDLKLSKQQQQLSCLLYCDLTPKQKRRLGASALAQVYHQVGEECPDIEIEAIKKMFKTTQDLIKKGVVVSGHDISDGGILTNILEMAFAGNCGVEVNFKIDAQKPNKEQLLSALFAEELGLLMEVEQEFVSKVIEAYTSVGISCTPIGKARDDGLVKVNINGVNIIEREMVELRDIWESTSFELEKLQSSYQCVKQEQQSLRTKKTPLWKLPFAPQYTLNTILTQTTKVKVGIVRAEGSNGDREMGAAIYAGGMEPWDVTMTDLLSGKISLNDFKGLVFVGGFSFADVLDSAKGWAGTILFNDQLCQQFKEFYSKMDTFSLGVCNGCQLMALLGSVPGEGALLEKYQNHVPRFIHNQSGRFESRWHSVRIEESTPCIWTKGMEGSVLGIWSAHGEGRAYFPEQSIYESIKERNLIPIRYCDADGMATVTYPENPNGSYKGIAALCSSDGRHLAMMPHPERCFLTWQLPWYPKDVGLEPYGPSPWIKLFQNAREWYEHKQKCF